jgi:nucleosome binding factor SPN SPT16 subunit
MRPSLTGRKTTGTLEAHENGFRFRSDKGGKLDVLYSNVRHAFFQPAKNELITVIHLHLRNDIMIGKKKARDVQFYTEVMEASQALDSRFQAFDGIEEEQRERELLNRINKEFQNFVRKVDELTDNVEFDLPYRELGFYGTPNKTNVLLQPTVHCLINVTEFPFFVVSLDDIEMVYLERVSFSLKNFDLVIVYKDYSRPVSHINAIPVASLETIKEWLDSCSIYCSEGATSLNWVKVMKTIRDDLEGFYEGGGWSFLDMDGSDDEEEHPSDEESDFEEAGDESDAVSSSDDSFSDGSFTEEDESSVDLDSEEEEGLSWDELERKAKKEDEGKRKRYDEDDDLSSEEERRSSKKKKKSRK